jgi:hypothetical protein
MAAIIATIFMTCSNLERVSRVSRLSTFLICREYVMWHPSLWISPSFMLLTLLFFILPSLLSISEYLMQHSQWSSGDWQALTDPKNWAQETEYAGYISLLLVLVRDMVWLHSKRDKSVTACDIPTEISCNKTILQWIYSNGTYKKLYK